MKIYRIAQDDVFAKCQELLDFLNSVKYDYALAFSKKDMKIMTTNHQMGKTSNSRQYGKTLPDIGYRYKHAVIYRAVAPDISTINYMDYITLSKKFAVGHADHMTVTNEEPFIVLRAIVHSEDVAEASNPGEYFYIGSQPISGTIIYQAVIS